MDNQKNYSQSEKKNSLSLLTQIVFCVVSVLFSFVGAIDPLGLVGLCLSIIASAMLVLLFLNFASSNKMLVLVLMLGLIPYISAAVYFGSVASAVPALYPLAMSVPIFLTVRMGKGRSVSIMAAALCSALLWIGYIALAIRSVYGSLNAETIMTMIDSTLEPIKEMLETLIAENELNLSVLSVLPSIDVLLYQIKTLLLGVMVSMMIVNSYFATLATRLIAGIFNVTPMLPSGARICMRAVITKDGPSVEVIKEKVTWRIELDSITAIVFIASYALSILTSLGNGGAAVLQSSVQNLLIILSPGFIYCGAREAVLSLLGRASLFGISKFSVIITAVMLIINPSLVAMLLMTLGVIVTLRENSLRKKRMRKQ